MRSFHWPLLLLVFTLAACKQEKEEDPQYQQYVEDTRRAEDLVARRDSTINDLLGTLNTINENLRTIRAKQGRLSNTGTVEQGGDMEEQIMDEIRSIDSLVVENQKLMERLRKNADMSATGIAELQRTINEMQHTIEEREAELQTMKEELSSTNQSMATLIQMYQDKSQQADAQLEALNTAYYAVGTVRELRANGILSREGGVAGLGGVNKLSAGKLPNSYFRKVDIWSMQEIPVVAKKASLVTPHPEGTYRFEDGAEKLIISDPEKFWSISKYLVVVVE
jgi:hypothetical protein